MSESTKKTLKLAALALGIGGVVFIVVAVIREFLAGERELKKLLTAPLRATEAVVEKVKAKAVEVADNAKHAAQLPVLAAESAKLDREIVYRNDNDYAPGGRIYEKLKGEQGEAAAAKAFAAVQEHDRTMQSQSGHWWQFWKN